MAHEAAHYVAAHHGGLDRRDAETVAEGAAFIVLHHHGLDTGGYTFPYIAGWAEDRAVLRRNLDRVHHTAERISPDSGAAPTPARRLILSHAQPNGVETTAGGRQCAGLPPDTTTQRPGYDWIRSSCCRLASWGRYLSSQSRNSRASTRFSS